MPGDDDAPADGYSDSPKSKGQSSNASDKADSKKKDSSSGTDDSGNWSSSSSRPDSVSPEEGLVVGLSLDDYGFWEDAFTPDLNYHLDNEDKSEGDVNKVEKDNSEEVPAGHDADR